MKKSLYTILIGLIILSLAACSPAAAALTTTTTTVESVEAASAQASTTDPVSPAASAEAAQQVTLAETHDDPADTIWDSTDVIQIFLNGSGIDTDAAGVEVNGSTLTIRAAGTYRLSGTLDDGQVIVDTDDEETVRLILDNASLHSSTSAPLYIQNAQKTVIILAENSQNTISDGSEYVFESAEEDEPNAALFSKADLTIAGSGSLTVTASYNDGIASKDGLILESGTITVQAVDDGIRGKDYLVIKDANITISAQGDGLKADNEEDASKGYILIQDGAFKITSNGDAVTAQSSLRILGGDFNITTSQLAEAALSTEETPSTKGLKSAADLTIEDGTFYLQTSDDALHSNANLVVNGGVFAIAAGDDAMHADTTLTINAGEINVTESYEGLESAVITINDGTIQITASDDGINVAGGMDGSGMTPGANPGRPQRPAGGPGALPADGQQPAQGQVFADTFNYSGSYYLYIHGGTITVDAQGDGLDANGAIEMTGGLVIVNGPTEQMNGALDYDGGFNITGGQLVAAGSAGMVQAPGASSSLNSVLIFFDTTLPAGTLIHIQDSTGQSVLDFTPTKQLQSLVFTSPALAQGETYTLFSGGSVSGETANGITQGGTYTPGEEVASFSIASAVTTVGSVGNRPMR